MLVATLHWLTRQAGIAHRDIAQIGISEIDLAHPRSREFGALQDRAAQIGLAEIGLREPGPGEVQALHRPLSLGIAQQQRALLAGRHAGVGFGERIVAHHQQGIAPAGCVPGRNMTKLSIVETGLDLEGPRCDVVTMPLAAR